MKKLLKQWGLWWRWVWYNDRKYLAAHYELKHGRP